MSCPGVLQRRLSNASSPAIVTQTIAVRRPDRCRQASPGDSSSRAERQSVEADHPVRQGPLHDPAGIDGKDLVRSTKAIPSLTFWSTAAATTTSKSSAPWPRIPVGRPAMTTAWTNPVCRGWGPQSRHLPGRQAEHLLAAQYLPAERDDVGGALRA